MENMLKDIKRLFFTYRNGVVADTLRKVTDYDVIFGLQVPQIAAIARECGQDMQLAEALWADSKVRESRLLATYVFPPEEVSLDRALRLAAEVQTQEEADMLAFRLLKRLPFAGEVLSRMESDPAVGQRAVIALRNHLS